VRVAGEESYLEKAIDRHSPEVAATARAGLRKLRARFPWCAAAYIRTLMMQALKVAGVDLKRGNGQVVLRSTIDASRSSSVARRRRMTL
jgi:hypothetical protein